eukprot:m.8353 g.8353  ORF g.8353 m.8353 type:complete len:551 (-) comp6950_c0_seq1:136-1788(-)
MPKKKAEKLVSQTSNTLSPPPSASSSRASTPVRLLERRKTIEPGNPSKRRRKQDEDQEGLDLEDLSYPPSKEELTKYRDRPDSELPKLYKRDRKDRVFCNRQLSLGKIKYYGFDMDYTLAVYNQPDIDILAYDLIVKRLIEVGYPQEIESFKFVHEFAIRGLFFDKTYGNLLKVDAFGHILVCLHGHSKVPDAEIRELYPNKYVSPTDMGERRFYVLNTLFNIPETCLYADIVEFFDNHQEYQQTEDHTGVRASNHILSYHTIFNDVRDAVDFVHVKGQMKTITVDNLEKYVKKEPRLPTLLKRMRSNGCGVFLATNSDYKYTNKVMNYLFDLPDHPEPWQSYFDLIIVSARKPLFFEEGTVLREVDQETGALKLGQFAGDSHVGKVFSGGSWQVFSEMLGARSKEILYIGDHIFGDVLKSKKLHAWRTFLVVPELARELAIMQENADKYQHIKNLEFMLAEVYRGLDSETTEKPDVSQIKQKLQETAELLDSEFSPSLGGLFRSGTRSSFFAMQTQRYADLYAPSFINLINYPFCYEYRDIDTWLPHEA